MAISRQCGFNDPRRPSVNSMRKRLRSGLCVNSITDEELIARCARGDRHAMDVLVSRYHARLLDFALRHLRDRDASADVAQAALLRAFECAQSYHARASFRTWLYTIALNMVRDEFRKRKTRRESLVSDLEEGTELPEGQAASAEDFAFRRAEFVALWEAVGRLPESHRTAVVLKFRQGLTYEEIAVVMGAPAGTVKSWVHYAMKSLRETLGGEGLAGCATEAT